MKYLVLIISTLWVSLQVQAAPELKQLSIHSTQQKLAIGEINLQQLADYYLQRIDNIDKTGPKLNSVVQINPNLKQRISLLQQKQAQSQKLGQLFGVFVLLKDNIDTADGMANTAGSWLLRNHKPKQAAFLVQQLLAQDAIILGKTNLSEWANFRSTMSSSGWSSLYGQTLNPYDVTRSPCGSSSGSAVAIAADLATIAIGTETDGSVTCPSAINGLVGIKPTLGLISRTGIIPIAHSQDTAGPMARSVTDAVLLLEAMMGKDPEDKQSFSPTPLSQHLITDGLKGKRIGIVTNLMGYHPQLDKLFEQQLVYLRRAGAQLIQVELSNNGAWAEQEYQVLLSEFKTDLAHYLKRSQAPIKNLQQLIEFNKTYAKKTMPIFGQDIFEESLSTFDINSKEYRQALKASKRLAGKEGIDATLKQHKLDLLIAPTGQPAWKIDHINGDQFLGSATSPAAVSGYPHITVPMGMISGLPVGMSFFAGHLSEGILIEAAYAYEQQSKARVTPDL